MNFSVIGVAKRLDVDFIFEPTVWLEPIDETILQTFATRGKGATEADKTSDVVRSHEQG
jgi:hypothetical protein